MFELKELIETGIEDGIDSKKLLRLIAESIDDEESKINTYENVYQEVYGNHLCDKFCKKVVEHLSNDDESGQRWTLDQTNDIARKIGISFSNNDEDYTPYEFWCAMHKEYYCHGESLKESNIDDPMIYGKFADDYLTSKPKGKLVNSFFYYIKNESE